MGILLGAPTLKLRGDYLAIVTLGFGEIIRVFLNNLDHPVNITNGPQGASSQIDSIQLLRPSTWARPWTIFGFTIPSVSLYYYLFLALVMRQRGHLPPPASSRASAAPGWRSAKTRSPPRPWASTPAT